MNAKDFLQPNLFDALAVLQSFYHFDCAVAETKTLFPDNEFTVNSAKAVVGYLDGGAVLFNPDPDEVQVARWVEKEYNQALERHLQGIYGFEPHKDPDSKWFFSKLIGSRIFQFAKSDRINRYALFTSWITLIDQYRKALEKFNEGNKTS